ncbi:hypothetical protein PG985_010435 [Apiospora marii]|uniref:Uncharacterized protein n=1 Tax=Apiospora marii TaxID=335849 RepID=A0ABR1RZ98_9PEZI
MSVEKIIISPNSGAVLYKIRPIYQRPSCSWTNTKSSSPTAYAPTCRTLEHPTDSVSALEDLWRLGMIADHLFCSLHPEIGSSMQQQRRGSLGVGVSRRRDLLPPHMSVNLNTR